MATTTELAAHVAARLAFVMAIWGLKRLLRPAAAGKAGATQAAAEPGGGGGNRKQQQQQQQQQQKVPRISIISDPASDYAPNNPRWLEAAAAWTPESIPAELLPEPPPIKAFKAAVAAGAGLPKLGSAACREQLFALDPVFAYLNHGSYGATLRLGLDVQSWYRQQMELEPVRFMEGMAVAGVVAAVAEVAALVGADWRDMVPVANATTAINTVVSSLQLRRGDLVMMTNATYPAVRSTLARCASAAGAGLLDLTLELEHLSDPEQLLAAYKSAIAAGGRRLRLVVVDHVVSFPPVLMPVQQICELCRAAGVLTLVDGAHAVGSLPGLDVPSLGCTFYTANLHKWLCTPKGTALLWVDRSQQSRVRPCVTSHGYRLGFRAEFLWPGTADLTGWLAVPACLAVLHALQLPRVMRHNHGLARRAALMLQAAWGTTQQLGVGADGATAGMVAVQLPWPLALPLPQDGGGDEAAAAAPTAAHAAALNRHLREAGRVEVPVACVAGSLWARISAQVYNSMADYERLKDAVLALVVADAEAREGV